KCICKYACCHEEHHHAHGQCNPSPCSKRIGDWQVDVVPRRDRLVVVRVGYADDAVDNVPNSRNKQHHRGKCPPTRNISVGIAVGGRRSSWTACRLRLAHALSPSLLAAQRSFTEQRTPSPGTGES